MKDIATVLDDLGWLYTEPSEEYARSAAKRLDDIAGALRSEPALANNERLMVDLLAPMAEAVTSMAHSLAHIVGLLEVIAGSEVTK